MMTSSSYFVSPRTGNIAVKICKVCVVKYCLLLYDVIEIINKYCEHPVKIERKFINIQTWILFNIVSLSIIVFNFKKKKTAVYVILMTKFCL